MTVPLQNAELSYMLRALELSQNALPLCQPNPPVGCVIVKNDQVIAEGFTQEIGGEHAEANAITTFSGSPGLLAQSTIFVTLEPCSFFGRTPSCAHMLANINFSRVVIAMLDPDPRNSGAGVDVLRSAGLIVEIGLGAKQVEPFLKPYLGHS